MLEISSSGEQFVKVFRGLKQLLDSLVKIKRDFLLFVVKECNQKTDFYSHL
jgi:hypothetical protein